MVNNSQYGSFMVHDGCFEKLMNAVHMTAISKPTFSNYFSLKDSYILIKSH